MKSIEIICKTFAHCQICRDKEGGRQWRESLRKAFRLPNDETDFECPHGLSWGCEPQTEAQKEYKKKADAENKRISDIGKICEACKDKCDCEFYRLGKIAPCKQKRMIRNGTAKCPHGKLWI